MQNLAPEQRFVLVAPPAPMTRLPPAEFAIPCLPVARAGEAPLSLRSPALPPPPAQNEPLQSLPVDRERAEQHHAPRSGLIPSRPIVEHGHLVAATRGKNL